MAGREIVHTESVGVCVGDRSAVVHAYRSGPTDRDETPGTPTTVLAWSTVPDGTSVRSDLTTIADPSGRY